MTRPQYAIIDRMTTASAWPRRLALAAALFLLNASLTFRNVWPTPAVRWRGDLSIELAVCVLALAAASRWLGPLSRLAISFLAAVWTILVVGHYAEVTAPALYGREVNLYWDLGHVSGVAAMLATAASRWLALLVIAGSALVLFLVYRLLRWALGCVGSAMADARVSRILGLLAAAVILLFVVQRRVEHVHDRYGADSITVSRRSFTPPVTGTYARQVRLAIHARAAARDSSVLTSSPPMNSDLSLVKGADVMLLFLESYGAVSFERPAFVAGLAESRAELEAAIHVTKRQVVSAYVDSPTFGGSSWLAHISLLTGIEVTDADTNALLMAAKRDTLVRAFGRQGYKTVAIMPGLWNPWPEGAFYGFDEIYGGIRLNYRGPSFGWWDVPDQWSLARFEDLALNHSPAFVFFPTINTHAPFSPVPPYQPDWARMSSDTPYEKPDVMHALAATPDWLDLGPSYVNSLVYTNRSVAGFLGAHPDRDFVMILVGDHQPPAAVTGEGAAWSVPVHVIASRRAVLDRLLSRGFQKGLTPVGLPIGRMNSLVPVLLDSFGNREPAE